MIKKLAITTTLFLATTGLPIANAQSGDIWNPPANSTESSIVEDYIWAVDRWLQKIIWEAIYDPATAARLAPHVMKWGSNLFSDSNKSQLEKSQELLSAVLKDSAGYSMQSAGSLALRVNYSPTFGVASITWNQVKLAMTCYTYSNAGSPQITGMYYYQREAQYKIYKNNTLLGTFEGSTAVSNSSNTNNVPGLSWVTLRLTRMHSPQPVTTSRVEAFYDFDASRSASTTVYKVVPSISSTCPDGMFQGPMTSGAANNNPESLTVTYGIDGRPSFWPEAAYATRTIEGPWLGNQTSSAQDGSGKVTVAVFERVSEFDSGIPRRFRVTVPADYVVIGGGAEGLQSPYGNMLTQSEPTDDLRSWEVSSKEHIYTNPIKIKAWAIGMKVAGLTRAQLLQHIQVVRATSASGATPEANASVGPDFVLAGGGFRVDWAGYGQLATASYPSSPGVWTAKSKQHHSPAAATIDSVAIGVRRAIPGVGTVLATTASETSPYSAYPLASAYVPVGYARTGCGAQDNWSGAGNMLWRIVPVGQNACTGQGKDHYTPSPATLDTYAIGLTITP